MMLLARNDVVIYDTAGPEWVLLHLDGDSGFAIDRRAANAWPVHVGVVDLIRDIESGVATLGAPAIPRMTANISDKQLAAVQRRWSLIENIVAAGTSAFDPQHRYHLVSAAAEQNSCALNTVRSALQAYWCGGSTKASLMPSYDRCGAPGVARLDAGPVKRGRRRFIAPGTGVNANRAVRRVMTMAIRRYFARNHKVVLKQAYELMLREQYCTIASGDRPGQESAAWREGVDPYEVPTLAQFRYHYHKFMDGFGIRKKRIGTKKFERNERALPSTARSETWGPGSRYLIDATILDIYLRSRLDRRQIVGRPVLYLIIDVFSGMIVGMYVGIENASWVGAAMAFANAGQSKVEYCREFGVEIDEEDWPCRHFPDRLEADKGEVHSHFADCLTMWFNLKVETAASARPDLKGMVEGQFDLLPAYFGPFVPGYIEPDFAERGARDYRLDGVLDITEITAILINIVLHRNNDVILEGYDRPAGMPASEVAAIPRDLWNWGIANRSGALVERPDWYTRFHLMPTGKARVTEHGLEFQGCVFISAGMLERRWLEKARRDGRWDETISFDPRLADVVFLHGAYGDRGYEICSLADASRAYVGSSFREIAAERRAQKIQVSTHRAAAPRGAGQLTARIESIVEGAVAKLPADNRSNSERVRGIRETRSLEWHHDGRNEALESGLLPNRIPSLSHPHTLALAAPKVAKGRGVARFLKEEGHA